MSGYLAQGLIGALAGCAVAGSALVAFRRRRMSFGLCSAWIAIAFLLGTAPLFSWAVRTPAGRIGVTPSGVVLGLAVGILILALFRLSRDVSDLRRIIIGLTLESHRGPDGVGRIAVVVPAYNESATIATVVRNVSQRGHVCLVVDDGSTDATASIALSCGAEVIRHRVNFGVGAALRTGLRATSGRGFRAIVQCDADGQHETDGIELLANELVATGADLVIGSRFATGGHYYSTMSRARRNAVSALARYASHTTSAPITDPTSGFRAFSPGLAEVIAHEMGDHYLADTFEVIIRSARGGYRVREMPTTMYERQGGVPSTRGLRLVLYAGRAATVSILHLAPPFSAAGRSIPEHLTPER